MVMFVIDMVETGVVVWMWRSGVSRRSVSWPAGIKSKHWPYDGFRGERKIFLKKIPKNISEKNSAGQPVESKHWPYDGFHDEDEHEVVKM